MRSACNRRSERMERLARVSSLRLVAALVIAAVLAWRIAASGTTAFFETGSDTDTLTAAELRAGIAENPLDWRKMIALSRKRASEGAPADSMSALEQAVSL